MPRVLRRDGRLLREAGERREAEGNDEERKPAGHVRFVSRKEPPTSSGGGISGPPSAAVPAFPISSMSNTDGAEEAG